MYFLKTLQWEKGGQGIKCNQPNNPSKLDCKSLSNPLSTNIGSSLIYEDIQNSRDTGKTNRVAGGDWVGNRGNRIEVDYGVGNRGNQDRGNLWSIGKKIKEYFQV